MDTKWKKSKSIIGFLAFLLGVSLLLEGALFFGTALTSSGSRRWISDSFASDWRDTTEFRGFVSSRLERLITMGAGGWAYGYYSYSGDDGNGPVPSTGPERWAKGIHEKMKEDKNVLYTVAKEGEALYSNSDTLTASTTAAQLPEGYGFLLQFDGEKVRAWKDGSELDLYGDGYYRFESIDEPYQWYVPGYKNFTVDEAGSKVKVTMAVINSPQIFIKGNYGNSGPEEYNELYYLKRNLAAYREDIMGHVVRMGVGLALVVVYVLLRKDKQRADMALARGTGKVWFEVKILAALLLVFFCLPRPEYLGDIWQELTYAYGDTPVAEAIPGDVYLNGDIMAELEQNGISYEEWLTENGFYDSYNIPLVEQTTSIGTAVAILSENGGWLFQEYLRELADHTPGLLAVFWGLYLLIVNDWRYNKRPWRRGVIAMLAAWGLDRPVQKRLSRVCGITAMTLLLLGVVNMNLLVYASSYRGGVPLEAVWVIVTPAALLMLVCAVLIWRLKRLWTDFGAVADQAAAVRAGELERELALQENSDLSGLADDLNHIRQGLHQAVEERTRSERMKVELVTNVSHDLKTPLTSIISYTELLSQEPLEPPASEYVQIMGEKAQRLKAMVQDVFEVSKAASGQLPVKLERLDYARLLRQTLADMAQAIDNSGLTLRPSIPDGEVPITADSDRLYRVFQNLIGNALKYSLAGSRVYLTLTVAEGQATATVRNTSAAELKPGADYTARFVRGDESRTDGGSGLGLSIADSFTRACGGQLTVTTEADLFTACVVFPVA
ncbi:sensor histidine kinase [Flintibacter muris]|uniref:sensor histidine kinase n=1 Tax=Flintibacter muris TaxID=2941327 RepID=UPI00204114D6|nr:HAMP domain-containing sensor histidine kinase [Flintibacter muris]